MRYGIDMTPPKKGQSPHLTCSSPPPDTLRRLRRLASSVLLDASGAVAGPYPTDVSVVQTPVAPGTVRLCIHPDLRFLLPRRNHDSGELDLPHDPTATGRRQCGPR